VTVIKAIVRQGRLETNEPIDLPDGTELLIPLATAEDQDRAPTREETAAALAAMDKIEPFSWTEQERADWHADRKARRDAERGRSSLFRGKRVSGPVFRESCITTTVPDPPTSCQSVARHGRHTERTASSKRRKTARIARGERSALAPRNCTCPLRCRADFCITGSFLRGNQFWPVGQVMPSGDFWPWNWLGLAKGTPLTSSTIS